MPIYTYTTIDDPLATNGTRAFGINASGQIVGTYQDNTGLHGFLLSGGTYTTIDVPSAATGETFVTGINATGQIVGTYADATGLHGFLETTFPNPSPPAGTTADMILRGANSHIVDAKCLGAMGGQGIVNGDVETVEVKEAVRAGGVVVRPDDLAHIVDAEGTGAARGQGIVEGGVDAVAEEEAVLLKSAVFEKEPHDLARVVDAL